jgi:iron complex transport system substrate-binding protein
MRTQFAVVAGLLVVTALVGGAVGMAAAADVTGVGDRSPEVTSPATAVTPQTGSEDETCSFPLSMTDATGQTVTLESPPERIVTTNPSAAQTLWELGARDRVVGVTQYASYLEGTARRTNVSAAGLGVSVERVVGADPDLVMAPNASAEQVESLREAGLTVYHFPAATSIADIAAKTTTTGRLIGACAAAADTNAKMRAAVDATRNRTAGIDRPAALYPLGGGFVAGGDTFVTAVMEIGGLNNVAAERAGYPQLSDEVVLQADPEVLVVTDPDAPILETEPYASTTAGQTERVVVVEVQWMNQPAPRSVVESTETIADAVTEPEEAASTDDRASSETIDGGADSTASETGAAAPGFGVPVAILAVLFGLLGATRRRP